ncbi:gamma-glutamylcyclotransferase [Salinactinospora qingdaonensis]|uniref:Gamma-glutamylcyclotransferase n=1 Tax=Salinactinospora qingdaonensis TaxID=702744 RepID=A0ABP7G318_9ACTN
MAGVPLYAAYGSNLDPDQMSKQAPRSPLWNTGWLQGWRLTFGGGAVDGGALATLAEEPSSSVFVALYDVAEWDEPLLEWWEDTAPGTYTKIRARAVTLFDGELTVWTYVLDDYEGGLPSASYLGRIADAAERAGAPANYVTDLRLRPSAADGP